MSINLSKLPKENTLEGLIEGLDKRGLLVLQILLGQQAMKLLTEEKVKEHPVLKIISPDKKALPWKGSAGTNAEDIRSISIPTEG